MLTPKRVVLSVLLWHLFQGGRTAEAAALATIIIAGVIPMLVVARRVLVPRALAE